jgi:predicted nucleic acid-binding protein
MSIVLDASVALGWQVVRENPKEAEVAQAALEAALFEGALVPSLWFSEISNALLVGERRGAFGPRETQLFRADLDTVPLETDTARLEAAQERVLQLARAHELTAYDATYLELAERTGSRLATFDRQLAEAARAAGVGVFGD